MPRNRLKLLCLVVPVLAAAGCGSASKPGTASRTATSTSQSSTAQTSASTSQPGAGSIGPEGVLLESGSPLASAATTLPGRTVDGIQCAPVEQLAYHIHAHLQVYVNGQPRELPPAIGMVGPVPQQTANGVFYGAVTCYYWLHVHAGDGIIHIESPTQRIYTLGDFFDEWGQPLQTGRVADATGSVTAFLNGRRWTRNVRAIPLLPHAAIQLDVGAPAVGFHPVSWAGTGL